LVFSAGAVEAAPFFGAAADLIWASSVAEEGFAAACRFDFKFRIEFGALLG
jgi:hypothetical protein